jgi:hypothetical protein
MICKWRLANVVRSKYLIKKRNIIMPILAGRNDPTFVNNDLHDRKIDYKEVNEAINLEIDLISSSY